VVYLQHLLQLDDSLLEALHVGADRPLQHRSKNRQALAEDARIDFGAVTANEPACLEIPLTA
jgi:hypothetical protein